MVCLRCVRTVTRILTEAGLRLKYVRLGEVEMDGGFETHQKENIRKSLLVEGFELLDGMNSRLVEQIKKIVISEIHYHAGLKKDTMNFSEFIAQRTGHDYSHLSKLFSSVEGITIEKYIISQKIERAKELLTYDERSLSEIAGRLDYSSSQHLSNQFKQLTGMTPTEFKRSHHHKRKHLDHV